MDIDDVMFYVNCLGFRGWHHHYNHDTDWELSTEEAATVAYNKMGKVKKDYTINHQAVYNFEFAKITRRIQKHIEEYRYDFENNLQNVELPQEV
jgi:hypothetical protein